VCCGTLYRYRCESDSPLADCSLIDRFVPIEIASSANVSTKLVVVASRTGSSSATPLSTVVALDSNFDEVVDVTGTATFPGDVTVLKVGSNVHHATLVHMVYGGNAQQGPAQLFSPQQCGGDASASVTCASPGMPGCAMFMFTQFQASQQQAVDHTVTMTNLGNVSLPCEYVIESAFFHDDESAVFTALTHNPSSGAWKLRFFGRGVGQSSFRTIATWTLLIAGVNPVLPEDTPLTFEAFVHYSSCRPGVRAKKYALGGFFNPSVCVATPLLVVAGARRVSVFKFTRTDATVDLKVRGGVGVVERATHSFMFESPRFVLCCGGRL